ncbi:MAG: ABC transporter substrate-binding protein [Bacteroidota bacterium]
MRFQLFCLAVLVALAASACGGVAPTTPAPGSPPTAGPAATEPVTVPPTTPPLAEPAVLHVGWLGKPDTLNPAYAYLTESYVVFDLIYTPLTTEAPDGKYVGGLAKDWSVSDDNLAWTFNLKDGIKWHNGEPLTADQVAWAIDAVMKDPDGWASLSSYVNGFTGVAAPDDKTVVITTEYPIANMEYRVSFLYALYPPDFEKFTTAEDLQNFTNFEAIGTGMFKINTFDKDTGVLILDANKDYFGGAPKIDQVIFQTFDNSDAMIQALKVGEVDMLNEVPATAFATVQGFENVKAVATDGRYLDELIINTVDPNNDPKPTGNPALADPAVRKAIALSINKQDIVDIALDGLGSPAVSLVPPTLGGGFWYNPNLKDYTFNTDEAASVLEQAGYTLGSDGVRAKGKVRLEFRLQFPSDSAAAPRVADMMAGWFSKAGMKANPESVDPDGLTAAITPAGDYDLVLWGWGSDPDPDFILSVMTTDQFVDGGWSDSGYHNPEYDKLYLDQQQTVDKTKRQEIIWKMQEMVFNDMPYIILYYEKQLQAYRSDRFTGFIESPLGIEVGLSLLQVEPVK